MVQHLEKQTGDPQSNCNFFAYTQLSSGIENMYNSTDKLLDSLLSPPEIHLRSPRKNSSSPNVSTQTARTSNKYDHLPLPPIPPSPPPQLPEGYQSNLPSLSLTETQSAYANDVTAQEIQFPSAQLLIADLPDINYEEPITGYSDDVTAQDFDSQVPQSAYANDITADEIELADIEENSSGAYANDVTAQQIDLSSDEPISGYACDVTAQQLPPNMTASQQLPLIAYSDDVIATEALISSGYYLEAQAGISNESLSASQPFSGYSEDVNQMSAYANDVTASQIEIEDSGLYGYSDDVTASQASAFSESQTSQSAYSADVTSSQIEIVQGDQSMRDSGFYGYSDDVTATQLNQSGYSEDITASQVSVMQESGEQSMKDSGFYGYSDDVTATQLNQSDYSEDITASQVSVMQGSGEQSMKDSGFYGYSDDVSAQLTQSGYLEDITASQVGTNEKEEEDQPLKDSGFFGYSDDVTATQLSQSGYSDDINVSQNKSFGDGGIIAYSDVTTMNQSQDSNTSSSQRKESAVSSSQDGGFFAYSNQDNQSQTSMDSGYIEQEGDIRFSGFINSHGESENTFTESAQTNTESGFQGYSDEQSAQEPAYFDETGKSISNNQLTQQTLNISLTQAQRIPKSPARTVVTKKKKKFDPKDFESLLSKAHNIKELKRALVRCASKNEGMIDVDDLQKVLTKDFSLLNKHHRDWNKEYQELLEQSESVEKFKKLSQLAHDFVYAATTYAKIIISEQCLRNNRKTIAPISVGGVAGGQKFLCQNIIFKFALDLEIAPGIYMYGGHSPSDECAMKAAAHELKGLCKYYSTLIDGLHYPMLAYIDYKGFRMIAISVLPIGKNSLCYGSADSGVSVIAYDPQLNKLMDEAGRLLNLKKHISGTMVNQCSEISSCGDLEVHKGTDGKYYILDFARAFPPEAPPIDRKQYDPRAVFYKLLRPELVRSNDKALSSDAFTTWGMLDPKFKQYNGDVLQATCKLLYKIIPQFAKRLDEQFSEISGKLITEIHREGINVRHLGQIRQHSTTSESKELLFMEMIVRCIKNQLRHRMRYTMREVQGLSQEPFKSVVIKTFNLILEKNQKPLVDEFWEMIKEDMVRKYYNGITKTNGLTDHELKHERIYNLIKLKFIIKRLIEVLGIRVSEQAIKQLEDDISSFEFVDSDIIEVQAQPRFMDIIDYAEAMSLKTLSQHKTGREKLRLLELSAKKFSAALYSTPANYLALYRWGEVLFYQAKYTKILVEKRKLILGAIDKFHSALSIFPDFIQAIINTAEAYLTIAMNFKEENYFRNCAGMFLQAIKINPNWIDLVVNYLDKLLAEDSNKLLSLKGIIVLCNSLRSNLNTYIIKFWLDAIVYLSIYFHSAIYSDPQNYYKEIDTLISASANFLLKNKNEIQFFIELINRLTDLASEDKHKHLYYIIAELYCLVIKIFPDKFNSESSLSSSFTHSADSENPRKQKINENLLLEMKQGPEDYPINEGEASIKAPELILYINSALAIWEYSKTIDINNYPKFIEKAANLFDVAVYRQANCLDDFLVNAIKLQKVHLLQIMHLLNFSTHLKNRFYYLIDTLPLFYNYTLSFSWTNIPATLIQIILSSKSFSSHHLLAIDVSHTISSGSYLLPSISLFIHLPFFPPSSSFYQFISSFPSLLYLQRFSPISRSEGPLSFHSPSLHSLNVFYLSSLPLSLHFS